MSLGPARLKAINEAVGPALIVELVKVIDPAGAY
jgi:hypothetical protein